MTTPEIRDDIASMVSENRPQSSQYLRSLLRSQRGSQRPVTINIDNEINPATAYPSPFISIDAEPNVDRAGFDAKLSNVNGDDSLTLPSTTKGRPNTYRSRTLVAAERREKAITTSSRGRKSRDAKTKGRSTRLDPAPGRAETAELEDEEGDQGTTRGRRGAAITGEEKRKLTEDEDKDDAPDPKRRKDADTTGCISTDSSPSFPPSSVLRKRDRGIRVPKSFDQAGEADRMLWEWKHAGKPWIEITKKWTELTNKTPGKSTLSVRFIKLQENFSQSGGEDDILLLKYKEEAENELEDELWQRVSTKIKTKHDVDITADQLRKRYSALRNSGFKIGGDLHMSDNDEEDALERPQKAPRPTKPAPRLIDYSSESDI